FTNGHSGLTHSSTTYFPLYWESECVWPFASGSEKSGAALPTGGGSKAKIAVAINDVKTVKVTFLFIDGLENEVVKVVQFSFNQYIGKERRQHKRGRNQNYCAATLLAAVWSFSKTMPLVSTSGKTIGSSFFPG